MKQRLKMTVFIGALAATSGSAQVIGPGIGNGKVTDDGGVPVSGAIVRYQRIPQLVGTTAKPVLAPGEVFAQGTVATDTTGAFSVPSLPSGNYLLCASSTSGAYIDQCKWGAAVPAVIATTSLASPALVVKKGASLTIQINDPNGLLSNSKNPALNPGGLVVGVKYGNGAFVGADTMISQPAGRTYQISVPVGVPLAVWLHSKVLTIADSTGKALALPGALVPFEATAGQNMTLTFSLASVQQAVALER
jgi:hypothetical protein